MTSSVMPVSALTRFRNSSPFDARRQASVATHRQDLAFFDLILRAQTAIASTAASMLS